MNWKLCFLFILLAGCANSQKAADNLSARKSEAVRIEDIAQTAISDCKSKPVIQIDGGTINLTEKSHLLAMEGHMAVVPYEVVRLPASLKEFFIQSPTGVETASTQWNALFPEIYAVQGISTLQPLPVTYGFLDTGLKRRLISKIKISQPNLSCLVISSKIQSSQEPVAIFSFSAGLARVGVQLNGGGPRKAIYAYPYGDLVFSSKINGSAQWEKIQ